MSLQQQEETSIDSLMVSTPEAKSNPIIISFDYLLITFIMQHKAFECKKKLEMLEQKRKGLELYERIRTKYVSRLRVSSSWLHVLFHLKLSICNFPFRYSNNFKSYNKVNPNHATSIIEGHVICSMVHGSLTILGLVNFFSPCYFVTLSKGSNFISCILWW